MSWLTDWRVWAIGGVGALAAGIAAAELMRSKRSRGFSGNVKYRIDPKIAAPMHLSEERGVATCAPTPGRAVRVCLTRSGRGTLSPKAIGSSSDAAAAMSFIGAADRESFWALHLDYQHNVIGVEEVAKGGIASVEVHPREVFKGALLSNAAAILVLHNHPSGNPKPSDDDVRLTARIKDAGRLMGIPLLDHVVIGRDGEFVSLASRGLM